MTNIMHFFKHVQDMLAVWCGAEEHCALRRGFASRKRPARPRCLAHAWIWSGRQNSDTRRPFQACGTLDPAASGQRRYEAVVARELRAHCQALHGHMSTIESRQEGL